MPNPFNVRSATGDSLHHGFLPAAQHVPREGGSVIKPLTALLPAAIDSQPATLPTFPQQNPLKLGFRAPPLQTQQC